MRNSGAERLFSPVLHGSDQKMSAISNSFFWLYRSNDRRGIKKEFGQFKRSLTGHGKFWENLLIYK